MSTYFFPSNLPSFFFSCHSPHFFKNVFLILLILRLFSPGRFSLSPPLPPPSPPLPYCLGSSFCFSFTVCRRDQGLFMFSSPLFLTWTDIYSDAWTDRRQRGPKPGSTVPRVWALPQDPVPFQGQCVAEGLSRKARNLGGFEVDVLLVYVIQKSLATVLY